ncbi:MULTISPECIES: multidrug efflux SMR transporter [Rhodomicrobium]|uniref:DMT family transporter n=1 Tax=Rhodomicrobium TaxID=1068 RepID=UPI000B4BF2CE|nr:MULTISPECIES: multidrug efflux SMR transporter [Rhodomicrobium]
MTWAYLILAIAAEVVATSALKASESFTRLGPSLIVVFGYGAAFYLLSLTLKTMPLGVVYALWSGLGIVLVALVGWLVFRQHLDAPAVIGIALILAGVAIINILSESAPH